MTVERPGTVSERSEPSPIVPSMMRTKCGTFLSLPIVVSWVSPSACDRALAMSMDEAKKRKDIVAERKLKDQMHLLKREPGRVEQYREKVPAPKKSL